MKKNRRFLVFRRGLLRQERGIVLAVIMMLLVALTGVVAFSARQAVVGESAARNQVDYELARQAAESALRDAERDIMLKEKPNTTPSTKCERTDYDHSDRFTALNFTEDCPQGQCSERGATFSSDWLNVVGNSSTNSRTKPERWWPATRGGKWWKSDDSVKQPSVCQFNGGVPLGTFTGAQKIKGVEYQPEYLIEFFPRQPKKIVRVTARGFGMVGIETQVVLQSYIELDYFE